MEVLYVHDEVVHNFNAAVVVLPFIIGTFKPESMLDIGCGIGTWLKIAKDLGVSEVIGVDGAYVDRSLLKINSEEFIAKDLRQPFSLNKKFDLALCLEVAEHLPKDSATNLITTLCSHSDVIIFSAAVPNQGGQNHLNEQWPSYWVDHFATQGFRPYDILRPVFWNDTRVEFWYKQNMIVFSKKNLKELYNGVEIQKVNAYIHPELFESKLLEINYLKVQIEREKDFPGVKNSFNKLCIALKNKLKIKATINK